MLDAVSLGVAGGDRIGVVGRNGDGKTTLLRVLAGSHEVDDGRVARTGGLRIGVLTQEDEPRSRRRPCGSRCSAAWPTTSGLPTRGSATC